MYFDGVRTGGVTVAGLEKSDDEDEQIFIEGEVILNKYKIEKNCGNATFSSCYQVVDVITQQ